MQATEIALVPFDASQVPTTNANAVLAFAVDLIRPAFGPEIRLSCRLDPALGPVLADPEGLARTLLNLVGAARQSTAAGREIAVETRAVEMDDFTARQLAGVTPGPYAMLAVRDTGVGMDEPALARLQRFFGPDPGVETGTPALRQVREFARGCGGHVWVYSVPGRGTSFRVYLRRPGAVSSRTAA